MAIWLVADVPCLLRHMLRFLKTSPFKNLKDSVSPLTCMENPSHPEVSGSYMMGSTLENLTLQHCVRMWEATPYAKISLLNRHFGIESVLDPFTQYVDRTLY